MPDNRQEAPYPEALGDLVGRLRYRPGWSFWLDDMVRDTDEQGNALTRGLTFVVKTMGYDSYNHDDSHYGVRHYFPVPPATYDAQSWRRWLLDQILKVETHEACEFFVLKMDPCGFATGNGEETCGLPSDHPGDCGPGDDKDLLVHPYAPNHGPGRDPYVIFEYATDEHRRTRFTGELLPR